MSKDERSLLFYWNMTQLVKEVTNPCDVVKFIDSNFVKPMKFNILKTSKDEVLQIYNRDICYTIIGGSSADKKEWRSNFNVGKLVLGRIHQGFYNLASEVLQHKDLIVRHEMVFDGHSRGAGAVQVISDIRGYRGYGFGSPKVFKHLVGDINFTNVYNPFDPVGWVVPSFKRAGKLVKVRFLKNPHTKYGKILKRKGL